MENSYRITRYLKLPDPIRVARYERAPDLGPRILFFSGGTAIRSLSQRLIRFTHNSVHIITPFDSGGSSAVLREHFGMLSVGDIRNRIMALADQSIQGNPAIYELFSYRMSKEKTQEELYTELGEMIDSIHPLIRKIPTPMRKIIRNHLDFFRSAAGTEFNLKGASIGNLILTGGYINNGSHIDPVIYIFSKLVEARGVVRPVANTYLHMVARFENGEVVVGQHLITGKEVQPIQSPVQDLYVTDNRENPEPVQIKLRKKIRKQIEQAELIVYPMGSFYSSIIANFLVHGVGDAVAKNNCPKIYIPATGHDPERTGLGLYDSTLRLAEFLEKSSTRPVDVDRLINFVLVDPGANYQETEDYGYDVERIKKMGVEVIETDLLSERNSDFLDDEKVIAMLLSFV